MTTGKRLSRNRIWPKVAGAIFSTTLWTMIGTGVGYHVGSNGGFRSGVYITAQLFTKMMDIRDNGIFPDNKYTDL